VVVVLPASMCAMIPMLRTLASSAASGWRPLLGSSLAALSRLTLRYGSLCERALPAVVPQGLVGLGHLVGVLAALDARPEPLLASSSSFISRSVMSSPALA